MPLIHLFGPDGSGKSSIAKALANELDGGNYKTQVAWMRGSHTFSSLIAKFFSHFENFKGNENPYYNIRIPDKMRRLWQLIEFLSALPIILVRFVIPNFFNRLVIAERYVIDFITWVSITTNDSQYQKHLESKFMIALALKADARIYVTADLPILIIRRSDNKKAFLNKQLIVYDDLSYLISAYILDTTNKSISLTVEQILGSLRKDEHAKFLSR